MLAILLFLLKFRFVFVTVSVVFASGTASLKFYSALIALKNRQVVGLVDSASKLSPETKERVICCLRLEWVEWGNV